MVGTLLLLRTSAVLSLALIAVAGRPIAQATATTVCPPPAESTQATPAPNPGMVVIACVGSRPLTETTFRHWYRIAEASTPNRRQHLTPLQHEVLTQMTMGFLLSAAWVQGEAKGLGVHLSAATVRRKFKQLRHSQFPKRREFRSYLRKSRQTIADLLLRVELDMLSERIQQRVTAESQGAQAQQEALTHFVQQFKDKWTSQTWCKPQYAVSDCGHVQSNL